MLTLDLFLISILLIIPLHIIYLYLSNVRRQSAERYLASKRDYRAERRAVHRQQIKEWEDAFDGVPKRSPYHTPATLSYKPWRKK